MRNIWTIFKTDIRTLSRCFFACVVVLAIALLPSLYAWLNIYSNWDPYGSTGGISIAVASLDRGYTDGGEYVNKGRDVLEDLKTATSINWVIVNTEKEATDGVCAGDYYAAVVIDEDFSRKMYRMFTDWNGRPAITYYENAKKNAVATKITDTAVETLKRSISENYLEVLIGGVMEQSNLLAADLTETDPETAVKGLLYQAQDVLTGCRGMMDAFRAAGGSGISSADAEALAAAIADINKNLPSGSELEATAAELQHALYTALARVERALDRMDEIQDSAELADVQQQLTAAAAEMGRLSGRLTSLADRLEDSALSGGHLVSAQIARLRALAGKCSQLQGDLNALAAASDVSGLLEDCGALTDAIRDLTGGLPVTDSDLRRQLDTVVSDVSDTLSGVRALSADARALQAALSDTTAALNTTGDLLRPAAERMVSALSDTIDKLEGLSADEYMDMLLEILGGDPIAYSQYFPQMVQTTVHKVYPIANYGSHGAVLYHAGHLGGLRHPVHPHQGPRPHRRAYRPHTGGAVLWPLSVLLPAQPDTGGRHCHRRPVPAGHPVRAPGPAVPDGVPDCLHLQPADLLAGPVLRRRGQGAGGGRHGHADRRLLRHVSHRAAAGDLPEDLPFLPIPLCHRRHA